MPTKRKPQLTTNAQLAVLSALTSRLEFAGMLGYTHGTARDLYTTLGYKRTLAYEDYAAKYARGDIASRIVNAPADATWRTAPLVFEDEEAEATAFEQAWEELVKRLKVFHYLNRVDRLAGVGEYAVLLIGAKDGKSLEQPLQGGLKGPDSLLYLSVYSQRCAVIHRYTTDPQSVNFGRPELYTIDLAGNLKGYGYSGIGTQLVHYTRVLHVAENLREDEVFGTPRLEGVFNRLEDLEKVVGGSAEMFWLGARQGLAFSNRPDSTIPLEGAAAEAMTDEIDEYAHQVRRYMRLNNIDVKSLDSQTPDPSGNVDKILDLIAGATGIPKRILTGSERGELASSQDETNWNARVSERQHNYAEPLVLRPLIDRLIALGALPAPAEDYTCEWPNLFELSAEEKANIGLKKSQAIATYANAPGAELVVPPKEFREQVLSMDPEPDPEALGDVVEGEAVDEENEQVQEQMEQGRRAA